MSDRFSDHLRQAARPIWDAIFAHPFLKNLESGELPEESFRYYLVQDYHFLEGFARAVALALSKAPDSPTLQLLAQRVPVPVERQLHRTLFAQLAIDEDEVESTEPAPTARAYMDHMIASAAGGDVGEAATALLPCPWTYHELGARLGAVDHPVYGTWASVYTEGLLVESVRAWRSQVDAYGRDTTDKQRGRLKEIFLTSSRYEYMFWDMAYRRQTWSDAQALQGEA